MEKKYKHMSLLAKWELFRLMWLAMKLNRDDFPIWLSYHGHVWSFDIRYMQGEYHKDKKCHRPMGGKNPEYIRIRYGEPLTAKQIRECRKRLLAASRYKENPEAPALSNQKFKVVRQGETLALMEDFEKARTYAERHGGTVIRPDWHLFETSRQ